MIIVQYTTSMAYAVVIIFTDKRKVFFTCYAYIE